MKIGVVLSESSFIPGLAKGMLHSLKHGLAIASTVPVDWQVEFSNSNANLEELKKILQKMLVIEQVDLVCMAVNPGILVKLAALFEDNATPLIALSAGEDGLFHDTSSPYIFVNGFAEQQASWMLAKQAVQLGYRKIAVFGALHESGYNLISAFSQGLQSAGGEISRFYMTHRDSRDQDISSELSQAREDAPDCLVGFYSSKEALSFLQHFEQGRYAGIPLVANSAMLTPEVLSQSGDALQDVQTISSWYADAPTLENRHFVDDFVQQCGRKPDLYSMLAYEVGLILGQLPTDTNTPLVQKLAEQVVYGPRGKVQLSRDGQQSLALHQLKVNRDNSGQYRLCEQQIFSIDKVGEQMKLIRQEVKQGWLNPYLIG